MENPTLWQIELIPWYAFCGYWLITWLRVKRTKAAESTADRSATLAMMFVAAVLLFSKWLRLGPLQQRFLPANERIEWAGIALTALGVAIAIWARYCLGGYWSSRVTLKENHQIIRSGPYARVRHPIYTGILLAFVGTAMVMGEWRGILASVLVLVAHARKAKREESLLTNEFGDQYRAYRRSTGFLFPRLWPAAGMDTHSKAS